MRKNSFLIHAGTIVIRLGTPIPVGGLTMADRDALMAATRESLTGMLEAGTAPKELN
jgi:hypothetical protein